MTKTTTRRDGPGLARLRKAANAEAIRHSVLADQRKGRPDALAKIEAESSQRWEDAIDIPASFAIGKPNAAPELAAEAPRPAPAPQARAKAAKPASARANAPGKRAAILASAQAGVLPAVPNFEAETHKRFRPKLAEVVALVEAGDAEALAAWNWPGFIGSSMRAVLKYRDLALIALEARSSKAVAA